MKFASMFFSVSAENLREFPKDKINTCIKPIYSFNLYSENKI